VYVICSRHCGLDDARAYKLGQRRLNVERQATLSLYQTCMTMLTQGESDLLTPEGYTNVDTFSTPDDFESYSPTNDPILKYTEDPPALIACVVYFSYTVALERWLTLWFSVMGVTGSGKTTVRGVSHPILPQTLTNTTAVCESSEQLPSKSWGCPRVLHVRGSRI